jgi:short-subunit dehydrogenase
MTFAERYGPWAIVAGASEGTGRCFARKLAARGLNCILVARREGPLAELARQIRSESEVECLTASIDLSRPEAFERIAKLAGDREVGLFVSNAGADPNGSHFLDKDVGAWLDLIGRNILTSVRCCHFFGAGMRERRRGGLLLVGSGACYGGGANLATYSGVKAFDLCFAEGLWAELKPHGVDVLYLAMTTTDTPALRDLLGRTGMPVPPGIVPADDVAEMALACLSQGPVQNWGQKDDEVGFAPAYGKEIYRGSGKGVIDWICTQHLQGLYHSHQVSNVLIELAGDRAGSESYVTASLRMMQGERLMQVTVWGRYVDRWSRRAGRWGLDERVFLRDFDEIREVTAMARYDTARRDRTDPSYAILGDPAHGS